MELNNSDECIQFALNYLASQTGDERLKQKLDSEWMRWSELEMGTMIHRHVWISQS